jgi:predicted nucleotidyltransferase
MQPIEQTINWGEVLGDQAEVRLALLFGSCARGSATPWSDVDLAVDAPGADLSVLAARISARLGVEVDVVDLRRATIPLLEALIRESVVVHEARRGAGATWRSRALSTLETDRPWYQRVRDSWLQRVAKSGLGDG